jgi:hypothetical protein
MDRLSYQGLKRPARAFWQHLALPSGRWPLRQYADRAYSDPATMTMPFLFHTWEMSAIAQQCHH